MSVPQFKVSVVVEVVPKDKRKRNEEVRRESVTVFGLAECCNLTAKLSKALDAAIARQQETMKAVMAKLNEED